MERPSWSRPPFPEGNTAAVRHGGYSHRVSEPRARAILDQLRRENPAWIEDVDDFALTAWARVEARVQIVEEYVQTHGELTTKGNPTPAASFLTRLQRTAADHRARLGLDPLSRARLGRDTAAARLDLAALWASEDVEGGTE